MFSDTSYLSEYDLQTLGEDIRYREEVIRRKPTVFFRVGDRTAPSCPAYLHVDEYGISYLGFIEKYGSHQEQIAPTLLPKRLPIRILSRTAMSISSVDEELFNRAYEELQSTKALQDWLQKKYPSDQVTQDSIVTVYEITYV